MTKQAVAAMLLAAAVTPLVFAHAVLLEAIPAANGLVVGPHIDVKLRFNTRVDPARSHLTVVLPDRSTHALRLMPQPSPAVLSAQIESAGSGAYRLQWQVLATDGHITRGEFPFQVK